MSRTISQKWLASNHGVQRRLLEAEQRGLHGYCEDGGRVASVAPSVRPSVVRTMIKSKGRKEGENKREETRTSFSRIIIIILIAVIGSSSGPSPTCCQNRVRHRHCSKEDQNHGGSREGAGRHLGGVVVDFGTE